MRLFFYSFNIVVLILSCNNKTSVPAQPINDTTRAIKLAIRTAFYHENLPGISPLKKRYGFEDSILTISHLPLHYLPASVDTLNFKVISANALFRLFEKESDLRKIPNYLSIERFEKNDSGYYINIKSVGYLPYSGGGSIGVYISELNDSLFVDHTTSSSIN